MKPICLLCLLLTIFSGSVSSQTSISLNPQAQGVAQVTQGSETFYQFSNPDIGFQLSGSSVYIYRCYFVFDLSAIPDNATIASAYVNYNALGSNSNFKFKLTKLSSIGNTLQQKWTTIGVGTPLETGLWYGPGTFNSNSIKTAIGNELSSNTLIIGALSESENTNGSYASLNLYLNVNYSFSEINMTVRNDLNGGDGGNVGVAVYPNTPGSWPSPYTFTVPITNRLNLAAYDNQNVNGKVWFFNDTECPGLKSDWKKKLANGTSSSLSPNASFTTAQLTTSDAGAQFIAFLKNSSATTSGTMSSSETWICPVTLTGNLTVPSGVTLTISSGVTVSLNGYSIVSTGGTIIVYGTVNGPLLKTGGTIKGIYPTIQAALSAATSGQTVQATYSQTLTANIVVPNGVTLNLGSTNLNGYSVTTVGGTITVQSVSGLRAYLKSGSTIKGYCGSIQTACTNAGTQYVVEVQSGTFAENISVSGKSGLTIKGKGTSQTFISGTISIYNATTSLNLNSFRCKRIYLNGCQGVSISSTRITGSGSSGGLSTYNTSYSGLVVTIENALTGLEAHSSSGGLYSGTHILDTGGSVSASYSSNINLYTNQSPNWVELCGIDDAHLAAGYGAYIIATNCSYDNGIPVINEYQGTVDVFGAYNCSGSSNSAVVAANPHQEGVNSAQGDDPALVEFREANNLFFDLSRRVNDDISATGEFDRGKFSSEYVNVINKFKSFIDKNPSSALSKTALTTAVHCFRALEDQDAMKSFLKRIKDHARLSKVSGLAKRFMIDYLSRRKDFDNAIVTANEIIEEQAGDKDLVCDVLFAKGLIYSHDLNQPAEAAQCFSNIINNYPDNPLVKLAGKELELLGYDDPKSAKQTAAGDGAQIMEFSAANYPNPFNPATEIRYALPSDGQVTIRIFNILGEQVRVVTDEFKFAGRYKVVWDGKNNQDVQVASGVYIYRISYVPSAEASGNVQPIVRTGKMNLLR